MIRKAMLDALPAIIAAASKPTENIDKISILDARGLDGEGGGDGGAGGGAGGGHGNLADAAVAVAMRYRVGGPLIDGLMAEIGMTGASLNGLLKGTAAAAVDGDASDRAAQLSAPQVRPSNGAGPATEDAAAG